MDPHDVPLAGHQPPLEETTRALRARAEQIKDAPDAPEAPPIPDLLTRPVQRPASMRPRNGDGVIAGLGEMSKGLAIGIDFLAMLAAGAGAGWLFDRWRGTLPIGTLVGGAVGFVVGIWRLLRRLNQP